MATERGGYRRLPDSFDDRARFIVEGVYEMDLIGDFGLVQGVAAGDEADGVDHGPGTPHHWGSTLSWNGYDNSASRITGNVLEQVPRSRPDRASLTLTQLRNEPG